MNTKYIYLLPHSIQVAAKKFPERPAFRCGQTEITYTELNSRMNNISFQLAKTGIKKGERVGILMHRCLETSYALYGIMNAGGVYVPLDIKSPIERLNFLIDNCQIQTIVTTSKQSRIIQALQHKNIRIINTDEIVWISDCTFESDIDILEDDPAYILYTSGSTGEPKGIVHTHRSGLAYAKLTREIFQITETDRIANHAPIHFDISTLGYFTGPLCGSCTVILTDAHTIMTASLVNLLEEEMISIWYSVPLALIQLLDSNLLDEKTFSSLRWVLYAGEVFPVKHLRSLMSHWNQARFCNVYGPTETNQCTHHILSEIPKLNEEVPIGMVGGNTTFKIEEGELLIRSATNMDRYWARPDLTSNAFARFTEDSGTEVTYYRTGDLVRLEEGLLYLQGRKDHMIKIRGFRVELGEIESVLLNHHAVQEAVATTIMKDGQHHEIIALVSLGEQQISEKDLIQYAKQKLPTYAVPSKVRCLESLPRTSNGKSGQECCKNRNMKEKIIDFIKSDLLHNNDLELDYEEDLLGSGIIESMAMMRLMQFVEEEFEITVEPQDMTIENFITVKAITEFVKRSK